MLLFFVEGVGCGGGVPQLLLSTLTIRDTSAHVHYPELTHDRYHVRSTFHDVRRVMNSCWNQTGYGGRHQWTKKVDLKYSSPLVAAQLP